MYRRIEVLIKKVWFLVETTQSGSLGQEIKS